MPSTSLLAIDGIDLGDYSVRKLTMTLKPIDAGPLRRDVNGNLVDLTLDQFRKYQATITCSDQEAPPLDDVWRGKEVTVTCIPELGIDGDTSGQRELVMMVDSWSTSRDEYEAETGWTLDLLEK